MTYREEDNPFTRELLAQQEALMAKKREEHSAWQAARNEADLALLAYRDALSRYGVGCRLFKEHGGENEPREIDDAYKEMIDLVLTYKGRRRHRHSLVWIYKCGWLTGRGRAGEGDGHSTLREALMSRVADLYADVQAVTSP